MSVKIEKYDRLIERFISEGKTFWKVSEDEANQVIFNAYCDSKGRNRDVLDISDAGWPEEIPAMVEVMKAEGITEFTVSDGRCGIEKILAVFEDNGAILQGLTRIDSGLEDLKTGKPKMKPAFLMKIM